MKKKNIKIFFVSCLALLTLLLFQNCSGSAFKVSQDNTKTVDDSSREAGDDLSSTQPTNSGVILAATTSPDVPTRGTITINNNISFVHSISNYGPGIKSISCQLTFNSVADPFTDCDAILYQAYAGLANGNYSYRYQITDNLDRVYYSDFFHFSIQFTSPTNVPPVTSGSQPIPQDAINLGANWFFIGDSQTGGREFNTLGDRLKSPIQAFENLMKLVYGTSRVPATDCFVGSGSDCRVIGESGKQLYSRRVNGDGSISFVENYRVSYDSRSNKQNIRWVHFQDSGGKEVNTDYGVQATGRYARLLYEFIVHVRANSPSAVISTETAYSFGDERASTDRRNWGHCTQNLIDRNGISNLWLGYTEDYTGTKSCTGFLSNTSRCTFSVVNMEPTLSSGCYNTNLAQSAVINYLEVHRNIKVHVVDVNKYILAWEGAMGAESVWFKPNEPNPYHYNYLGNFIIALGMFHHLGYDLSDFEVYKNDIKNSFFNSSNYGSITDAQWERVFGLFSSP